MTDELPEPRCPVCRGWIEATPTRIECDHSRITWGTDGIHAQRWWVS